MRWLLIALAVAVIPAALVAQQFYWEPSCGDEVLFEQRSPNEAFVFALHRRNCGATTDYATILSIRRAADDFDSSSRDDVLVIDGNVPVTASWMNVDRIEVTVPKGASIFRSEQEWNGVTISYAIH